MTNKKITGKKTASKASSNLKNPETGKDTKSASASALSQTKSPKKHTSQKAARAASKVLRDGRTASDSKSAAGSTLAQKSPKKKK